jgi:anaerobic ribonucleoside-triphosphate reductase
MAKWSEIPHCPKCDNRHLEGRSVGSLNAFSEDRICPYCGECIHWESRVERWVSTSTWWKPWTWLLGYWEAKNG